jgi:hypothetical protein
VAVTDKRKEPMSPAKKTQAPVTRTRRLARAKPEPEPVVEEEPVMTLKLVKRIPLGDNREVRVLKIPTGTTENLIRIGINLVPGGEHMSGAVFPESYLDEVVHALLEARSA